ncbi:MAG: transglutaminase-like domain-containing protein [Candidatus Accumulibacter sp.]|nr:transglutaminase-like domain-containing protein [Accumulibacter sp.]
MKRRQFIAASAVLAMLPGSPAQAAPTPAPAGKPVAPAAKPVQPVQPVQKKPGRPVAGKRPAPAGRNSGETPRASAPRNAISLPDEPLPQWRNYELRATLALNGIDDRARLWLPLMQYRDTPWERSFGHRWQGNFETAGIYRDPVADMEVFYADWPAGVAEPRLELVSQFATQDRHFDITRRGATAERGEILRRCLQPTGSMPTDGIARRTAERAIGRIKDPLAQAKAIYDWVVENAVYDPQARPLDHANIAGQLESGRLAGRSVEISLLFVGLCRAIGIPARPVFGLRIDGSRLFACLGAGGELNAAQHCRAEFYSPGYGWVPVNPSDVRKAILNENLSPLDPRLTVLKKLLFGFWEMNWIGFNAAQDVLLQGSAKGALPFLGSPVVETAESRFDDPASGHFSYSVTAQRT